MAHMKLLVGTRKGAWIATSDERREQWEFSEPVAGGIEVNHAVLDPRDGAIYVTVNDPWFGPRLHSSKDGGATWTEAASNPRFAGDPTDAGEGQPWFLHPNKVMERLWRVEPGRASEPGVLYCGVGPAALFRSDDGGASWVENRALSEHPTHDVWQPGAGGLILHSMLLDPDNADRMWVAISAAGVFRSDDGGRSWTAKNNNVRNPAAMFDSNIPMYGEAGQCVHHLLPAAGKADRLYLQGHWGTYRSDNGGDDWVEITEGLPSAFALAMTTHPHDRDTAYVVPLRGGEFRAPPEEKLRVFRTRDAGASWEPLTNGLPQEGAFMGVYRDALCNDSLPQAGLYLGTNTGQLYVSSDEGDSWRLITSNLPPITSVYAAVVE